MKLFKIAVCFCLVVHVTGQGDKDPEPTQASTEDPDEKIDSTTTNTESSDTTSAEDKFSDGTTLNEGNASDIGTYNDTIIVFSSTTIVGISVGENDSSSTVSGDETTFISSTTDEDENISEANKSACLENPCKSGGICADNSSIPSGFSCNCSEGFVGVRCEVTDNCTANLDGEVCKNGACLYSEDGLLRFCDCFTGAYWDEANRECREITSACDSSPCANGGTCNLHSDDKYDCVCATGFSGDACEVTNLCDADEDCGHGVCVLLEDKKTRGCKCNEGFYLSEHPHTCKELTTPCDSGPCQNGGMCNSVDNNLYNCTCASGFSGKACEIRDWCVTDEDCGGGICMLSEGNKTRSCRCNEGFYLENQSHTCKTITNKCQPNPCLHEGICTVVSEDDFNCTCSEGYTGKKCDIRNMCLMDGGNAYCNSGKCENNYELGVYYCTCLDGEYFKYTDRKCVGVDFCPLVWCESTETCIAGNCVCKDNYKWNNDSAKCEPDFCSSNPCPVPDMICEEGTSEVDFKCSCQKGYAFNGTHCNEALCVFPQLNLCSQLCTVADNEYQCNCDEDFQLKDDNHTCELKGNNTCWNRTCDNGSCVLKSEEEICLCRPGYAELNGNCTDVCSAGLLAPGICPSDKCEVSQDGGFRCKCEGKFALSEDKTTCIVRNICQENEIGWKKCKSRNADCVQNWNFTDGFKCQCSNGTIETEDGTCHEICSIEKNQRFCALKGATCDSDNKGNVLCRCPPYFQLNEKDGKCDKPADVTYSITLPLDLSTYGLENRKRRFLDESLDYQKITRDVQSTIEEMFMGFRGVNILHCNLTLEHILCKIELQFEREQENQLKRLRMEDICLTGGDKKKCLLPPSLVLVKERINQDVVIVPTDPCDDYIKEEICGSETTCTSSPRQQSFNCSCKAGFAMRSKSYPFGNAKSFVESCRDIDECLEDEPCPPNSDCFNMIGSYRCSCKSGFRNIKGSSSAADVECVEVCSPNTCTHGLCSRRGDHDFDCRCNAGYRGALCDLQDENFKQAKVNTVIVGVVLGGVLLITGILFAVCVSRLKKKKILENPGPNYYNSTEMRDRGRINNAFQTE